MGRHAHPAKDALMAEYPWLKNKGRTDRQIAAAWGVHFETVRAWKREYEYGYCGWMKVIRGEVMVK